MNAKGLLNALKNLHDNGSLEYALAYDMLNWAYDGCTETIEDSRHDFELTLMQGASTWDDFAATYPLEYVASLDDYYTVYSTDTELIFDSDFNRECVHKAKKLLLTTYDFVQAR